MLKNIAVRGKKDIVAIFAKVADISGKQDTGRKQATLDMIVYVASLPLNEDTKILLKAASKQRIDVTGIDDAAVPPSIKIPIEIEENTWNDAMQVFKYVFSLTGNPQMPYFLRVAGNAYIKLLEEQNEKLGVTEIKANMDEVLSVDDFKVLSNEDKLVEIYKFLFLLERR